MGAASMIVFPEPVGRSLLKLVEVTDAELSKFLSNCLSLKSDYVIRNRALRKLAANALTIESLEHGFAFEDIGTGFSRTNLRRFLLECLDVASSANNLDTHLSAIKRSLENGQKPRLERALGKAQEVVLSSFTSAADKKSPTQYLLIDRDLKALQTSAHIPEKDGEEETDRLGELEGLVKVRQLLSCLRNYLQTRSEVFAKTKPSRPPLMVNLSTPIDERVAATAVLRVFTAVGVGIAFLVCQCLASW